MTRQRIHRLGYEQEQSQLTFAASSGLRMWAKFFERCWEAKDNITSLLAAVTALSEIDVAR
jgi:hypothetical protein